MCRSGYYQLQQFRPLVRSMLAGAVKRTGTGQMFISCRLDYCNSLFNGITEGLMSRLQSAQNAAARLVMSLRPHHASATATGAALASGSTSGGFQDGQWPPWSTCHCLAWLQPI